MNYTLRKLQGFSLSLRKRRPNPIIELGEIPILPRYGKIVNFKIGMTYSSVGYPLEFKCATLRLVN